MSGQLSLRVRYCLLSIFAVRVVTPKCQVSSLSLFSRQSTRRYCVSLMMLTPSQHHPLLRRLFSKLPLLFSDPFFKHSRSDEMGLNTHLLRGVLFDLRLNQHNYFSRLVSSSFFFSMLLPIGRKISIKIVQLSPIFIRTLHSVFRQVINLVRSVKNNRLESCRVVVVVVYR